MDQFFRPRHFNTHTSLLSQILGTKEQPSNIHERLHNAAEDWDRTKAIREHVSSKTHVQRSCHGLNHLQNEQRQRKRETWEKSRLTKAPYVCKHSSQISSYHYLKKTGDAALNQPRSGVYAHPLLASKPIIPLQIDTLEEKFHIRFSKNTEKPALLSRASNHSENRDTSASGISIHAFSK